MHHQSLAHDIVGLTGVQRYIGIIDAHLRDALRIRFHIQHVSCVMRLTLRVAVLLIGRIEMSTGASRIGRAAITLLMKMKTEFAVGFQSLHHARDPHTGSHSGKFQAAVRCVALSGRQLHGRL